MLKGYARISTVDQKLDRQIISIGLIINLDNLICNI